MKGEPPQAQRRKRKGGRTASPSPSEGGDVPGGVGLGVVERNKKKEEMGPPQAPPEEGMCLAGWGWGQWFSVE